MLKHKNFIIAVLIYILFWDWEMYFYIVYSQSFLYLSIEILWVFFISLHVKFCSLLFK